MSLLPLDYDYVDENSVKEVKANNFIRVVHFFDKDYAYGGITVAYMPVQCDTKTGYPRGKFARVAVAYCRPEDRYSRKTGEILAINNLLCGENILLPIYENGHPVRFLRNMFFNYY